MKQIEIKAGEKNRIIYQFSNSLQMSHTFLAKPLDESKQIAGIIEIKGSNWLFPKPAETQVLKSENEVKKAIWDTFYSVYVIPEQDTKITLTSSAIKNLWFYIIIVLGIIAVASSVFFSMV